MPFLQMTELPRSVDPRHTTTVMMQDQGEVDTGRWLSRFWVDGHCVDSAYRTDADGYNEQDRLEADGDALTRAGIDGKCWVLPVQPIVQVDAAVYRPTADWCWGGVRPLGA